MVEGDRVFSSEDEVLVEAVEHLEERLVGADVPGLIGDHAPGVRRVLLPPDVQ